VLQLTTWPKSVQIHGTKFPVLWADLGDDQGHCLWAPEDGQVWIKIHQRFRDPKGKPTAWAWQVLFHEMCHAALAVSGASELLTKRSEEAAVVAVEAVWQAIRVTSRGAKDRSAGPKSNPRARRARPRS
jgi:hypothetical protein